MNFTHRVTVCAVSLLVLGLTGCSDEESNGRSPKPRLSSAASDVESVARSGTIDRVAYPIEELDKTAEVVVVGTIQRLVPGATPGENRLKTTDVEIEVDDVYRGAKAAEHVTASFISGTFDLSVGDRVLLIARNQMILRSSRSELYVLFLGVQGGDGFESAASDRQSITYSELERFMID